MVISKQTCYVVGIDITNYPNTDRSNSCTKVICDKCAERLGMTLDEILDKRDVDDEIRGIENDILGDDK